MRKTTGTAGFAYEDAVVAAAVCEYDYWRTHVDHWKTSGAIVCVVTVAALEAS